MALLKKGLKEWNKSKKQIQTASMLNNLYTHPFNGNAGVREAAADAAKRKNKHRKNSVC